MRVLGLATLAALLFAPPPGGELAPASLLGPECAATHGFGPHRLVLLEGMGNAHYPADTRSAEAQRWFDYGLQLAHGFAHEDATEAFRRAERADPGCALCVWGEAWSLGPTINYPIGAEAARSAGAAAAKAEGVAGPRAPEKTRALIQALKTRYAPRQGAAGNAAFAKAMDALHARYPDDVELAVLDADASMIASSSKLSAQHAASVLEPALRAYPQDAGAIHFYIHATERAGQPELAIAYADRLQALAPAASHLVHMPSHSYYRVGRYEDAAVANLEALQADKAFAEKTGFPDPLGAMTYHTHNAQFGIGGALMAGDTALAVKLAEIYARDTPGPSRYNEYRQLASANAYAALGRHADPARVLALPDPGPAVPFLQAMRRYARGEALARLGQAAAVRAEAAQIAAAEGAVRHAAPKASLEPAMASIARGVLEGRAAVLDRDPRRAIRAFQTAADLQDAKLNEVSDPPYWWYPVRRSLAAALLSAGDAEGAVREAQAALARWKLDPLTLAVLSDAEAALHRPTAAARMNDARRLWKGAPEELRSDRA